MLTVSPIKISNYQTKRINQTNPPSINTLKSDTFTFSNISFQGKSLAQVEALINKKRVIDGKSVFVNVEDFIKNGEKSLLCKKIPILKNMFDFRAPMQDAEKLRYTVGEHTVKVVDHLIHHNNGFKALNNSDKEDLLTVAFFHDCGKTEQILKKSLMKAEDFINADDNGSEFDKILKSKIEELKIFNPFSAYKQNIINYFARNPSLNEVLIHNNAHPETSVKLLNEFLSDSSKGNKELEKINYLISHHQYIGGEINKFRYKYITEAQFNALPAEFAKNITNSHDLNLIKTFHISDANGVPQTPAELERFQELLEKTCKSVDKIIAES